MEQQSLPGSHSAGIDGAQGWTMYWMPISGLLGFMSAYLAWAYAADVADKPAVRFWQEWSTPLLESLMAYVTLLGDPVTMIALVILTAAVAEWRGDRRGAVVMIAIGLGVLALTLGAKGLFDRPRPELIRDFPPGTLDSFPSGHTLGAASLYPVAAIICRRSITEAGAPWMWTAIGIGLLVGLSRIVTGMHWPSDVFAGWSLAMIVVWIGEILLRDATADL